MTVSLTDMSRLDELRWEGQPWMWEAPPHGLGSQSTEKGESKPRSHALLLDRGYVASGWSVLACGAQHTHVGKIHR